MQKISQNKHIGLYHIFMLCASFFSSLLLASNLALANNERERERERVIRPQ